MNFGILLREIYLFGLKTAYDYFELHVFTPLHGERVEL